MKKYLITAILVLIKFLPAQETGNDSLFTVHQFEDLVKHQQYASAHILLEDYIRQTGFKPYFVNMMVSNGLHHFYRYENYVVFYLKDSVDDWDKIPADSMQNLRTARLRYPQRLLKKIISEAPQNARAYKLLGDFYNIQYKDLSEIDLLEETRIKELEQKIFDNYSKAEQLGLQNVEVNRWLGDYYYRSNQVDLALKFFKKNLKAQKPDAFSYLRLAEIDHHKKLYTEAYQYASMALKNFPHGEVYLRYDALLLSARVLLELGERDKFLYYIRECTRLLPDMQDAYIDLAKYYESMEHYDQAEKTLRQMMLNNPYDLSGYKILEQYIYKHRRYGFGDKLFDELLVRFENSDEVMANIYLYKGNIAAQQKFTSEAKKFWEISRNYMRKYLPANSPLLKQVGELQ